MKSQGFTLLEILIVIIIISITASVATLTIHVNKNKEMETLAKNLAHLITLAEEEAILRPAVIGVAIKKSSYQFFLYDEKSAHWQPLNNKIFGLKSFDGITFTLKINNEPLPDDDKPHLIISPNGDIPAFNIAISNSSTPAYEVIGEENGKVYAK